MTQGVYTITNTINNKSYVGKSVNIEQRWSRHLSAIYDSDDHTHKYPLYKDMRKLGIEKFSFKIVAVTTNVKDLEIIENKYIKLLNSIINGYNQKITSARGYDIDAYQNLLKSKRDVDKQTLITMLQTMNFTEIGKFYSVSDNAVRKWCKNFGMSTHSSDYMTIFKRQKFASNCRKSAVASCTTKKPVQLVNVKTGKVFKKFNSITEASKELNVRRSYLSKILCGFENRKTWNGYYVQYL